MAGPGRGRLLTARRLRRPGTSRARHRCGAGGQASHDRLAAKAYPRARNLPGPTESLTTSCGVSVTLGFLRGRTSVSVIRSSQCQCTGQVGIRYRREVCSLAPESALWPSRKVSGPRLPRFASSPPNADYARLLRVLPGENSAHLNQPDLGAAVDTHGAR